MQFLKRLKPMVSPVQNSAANTIYVDSDTNEIKVGTGASGTTERVLVDSLSFGAIADDVLPSVDSTYDLGSATFQWDELHTTNLTATSTAVTSAVPVLVPDGSAAAPSIGPASQSTTGFWFTSGTIRGSISGTERYYADGTSFWLKSDSAGILFGAASDVSLSRGAANRLDLATGDSLYLVSGGLGVGVANTDAGVIKSSGEVQAGTSVQAAAAEFVYWSGRSQLSSPASGQLNVAISGNTAGIGLDFATDGTLKIRNRAQTGDALITSLGLTASGPTAGIGYGTGAGGTVTQLTDKSTGVTLNTVTGNITMNNAALAAGATVSFTLTDSAIVATDYVMVQHISGGTVGAYVVQADGATGSAIISVTNRSAGSLSEAVILKFVVFKAVTS